MAKATRKKVSKKRVKSSQATDTTPTVKPDMDYEDDDDEVVNEGDVNINSEDDESEDERKHQKLLEAISSLGGKRKKKLAERSEAAVQMSEFTVNAEGEGDKINLSDLIGTIDQTAAVSSTTTKQLKNLQRSKKTIECPLSKQETERIQRDVAFQKTAKEVSRWKSLIRQNQKAEQLIFPLNQEPSGPKPMEQVVSGWKARTPLEQEIFALLSINKQPINDPVLTPMEEASIRAMSLDEAKIRRAELQKARVLQSYYESKAKRERRIKSKKYHKVQNKAKRKEFLKQFDEMVKTNPTGALEELKKMELSRMQERMTLKHQNSGKWAKSKAIMAKYDEGARKAMQQQLEVNKDLTQKLVTSLNEEDDDDDEDEAEVLPDFVNDAEPGPDPMNPWMRGKLTAEPTEAETSDAVEPTAVVGNTAHEEDEDEQEVEETEEEALLREIDTRRKLRRAQESDKEPVICVIDDDEEETTAMEENKAEAEEPDASDNEEEEILKFTSLFQGVADSRREAEAEQTKMMPDAGQLEEGLVRIKTLEDMELLSQEESLTDPGPAQPPAAEDPPPENQKADKTRKRKRGIDLTEVLTKETKVIQVPLAPTVEDVEDFDEKEEQRGIIKEAFAGDDVVSDFLKDKRKQEEAGKPKVVDLTLPGWGEWGGTGLKVSRNKRRKFRLKAEPPPPRKDKHLPSVIMSEKRSSAVSIHQVSSLPFPFENPTQFESTIRTPVGRTWNTERTVKKITKPKVITQLGAIIEPITREELLKDKKQRAFPGKKTFK